MFAGLVLAALLYKPHKSSALNPIVRVITFGILFVMMLVLIAADAASSSASSR